MVERCDVVVMGGGFAGLTLALQLRRRFPALEVTVLERTRYPVPTATHKVGESLVEIGAHYLDTVLGLEAHLATRQLRKFGFRFFHSDGRLDVDRVSEVGITRHFPIPTYQIDRGIFENFLAEHARQSGVRLLDGAVVRDFTIAEASCSAEHEVVYERKGADDVSEQRITARWLVDASGRAGLLKRRLGLEEPNEHHAHGVWFRVRGRIDVDDWSDDRAWLARCTPRHRWLSTSHLVGEGYWVWLIPLASGSHSVGIVADPRTHPLGSMNTFERAMQWLARHQPRLARDLEARRETLQDFKYLRGFSYGCKQVFSGSRWAMTGEAGVFLDPLYSPGTDFIAIANTYITDLIARDLAGEPIAPYARLFGQLYLSFYRSTLSLYVDQYVILGDPEVLPFKVYWDYAYYWGVLCQLFFHGRLTDVPMMASLRGELAATFELNQAMQSFLRAWSRVSAKRNGAGLIDQNALDWFVELNRGLADRLDEKAFRSRIGENAALLHGLAEAILEHATGEHFGLQADALRALIAARRSRDGSIPRVPLRPQAQTSAAPAA
jgi:flavin-dependent dehydrogenase